MNLLSFTLIISPLRPMWAVGRRTVMRLVNTLVTEISGQRIGMEKMTRAELRYTVSNTASHTIRLGEEGGIKDINNTHS